MRNNNKNFNKNRNKWKKPRLSSADIDSYLSQPLSDRANLTKALPLSHFSTLLVYIKKDSNRKIKIERRYGI